LFENGTDTGVITFTVPATVPDTLYYESSADAAMVGTITFSSTPVPTVGQKGVVVLGALMMGGGLMGLRRRRALKAIDGRRSPRSEQKS
jgi:hypothetical protein